MTFRGDDDYEYVDDDDYYGDPDEDEDEDEELGGDWRKRLDKSGSGSSNLPGPTRTGGLPGSSRGSSVYGSKSDSSSSGGTGNLRDKVSPFGGNTPSPSSSSGPSTSNPSSSRGSSLYGSGGKTYGGTSSSGGKDSIRDRMTRTGDTGNLRSSSSGGSSGGGSDWRSNIAGSSSTPSSSPSPSGGSSGGTSDWRSKFSGDSGNDKKDDKKDTGNLGSRFGGGGNDKKDDKPPSSSNRFSSSTFGGGSDKKDEKADDKSSSGSRFGNRFGGGGDDKKDDKKDDKSSSGSRFGNRFGGGGDDKKDDKKDDKSSSGSRFGNRFGGGSDDKKDDKKDDKSSSGSRLGNRFGGGNKQDNKKDDKSSSGSRFGNRFGGGGDDKKDDKKDDKSSTVGKTAAVASVAGIGNRLGGLTKRFGRGGDDSTDKKASSGDKSSGGRGGFRNRNNDKSSKQSALGAEKSGGKSSRGSSTSESGGQSIGSRFGNLFNRGGSDDKSSKQSKPRQSKAPTVASDDWFDLDRKLDLVGVGLVFGSILLFFSALSQEQAAISFVHNLISQVFGWGAIAVPIAMFAVGMWLIVRHFGDTAPTIDPLRLGGVIIGFIGLLALFQYFDSFNYIDRIDIAQQTVMAQCSAEPTPGCSADIQALSECDVAINSTCLEGLVKYSYEQGKGGGLVGGWLYLTLVQNVTEIGGFVIVAAVLTFAAMLITHLSMAEIAVVAIGVARSARTGMAQRAAKRRAERLRAEQQKALAAQTAQVSVSTPAPVQLPGFAPTAALPEPSDDGESPIPIEERDILIRRGGQAYSTAELEQQPILLGTNGTPQPQPQKSGSGLLGGIFRRNKEDQQPVPQSNPNLIPATAAAASGAGVLGRLFNRGGDEANTPQPQPIQQPQLPMSQPTMQGTNLPVGGTMQPKQQPDQQRPPIPMQPLQEPVAQPSYQPPLQPPGQQPVAPSQAQPIQQPVAQPQQSPQTIQPPTPQGSDPRVQRQDRLNAIRSGMTSPPPQQPVSQATTNGGGGNGHQDFNAFGRPDDIPTHETEDLPGLSYSSTTPITTNGSPTMPQPEFNAQKNRGTIQKPVSSGPINQSRQRHNWKLPDFRTLLASGSEQEFDREHLLNQARIIEETLNSFGAPGRVVEVNTGPVITQFGVEPDYLTARSGKKSRVKVSAIAQLDKDLQLALGAKSIRVEAPVPGKGYVGIEVPNSEASLVSLRDVMESDSFQKIKSPLAISLGMSVDGSPIAADLTAMPHLLIAGTTGSGKSVCVNAIINSIMATNAPDIVKFIMVDPKRVELTGYNGIPHLIAPVVVELERIVGVLKWVTREMDERYKKFSSAGSRNIIDYNKHRDPNLEPMPYIVVIIDELADLMMLAPEETERTITRIAALARATGIHLVIATQRPSVDVVTGLIKANFPARIAFAVAGGVDSRVILDQPGAERLLGKGDMLYLSGDSPAPLRLQGVFVSDMEITNITRYWKMQSAGIEEIKPISILTTSVATETAQEVAPRGERVQQQAFWDSSGGGGGGGADFSIDSSSYDEPSDPQRLAVEDQTGNPDPQEDELYETAVQMVRRLDKASISLLQRRLRIGYTRAARLIDMMEERGVVGPSKEGSSKPRDVIPETG